MAFVGIDDQLRLGRSDRAAHARTRSDCGAGHSPSRSPTTMSVGVLMFLMKLMAEHFCVDGGIVIDGGAEVGNHPLVDGVFAVVALPVGDAGAGDGGFEALWSG